MKGSRPTFDNGAVGMSAWIETGKLRKRDVGWPKGQLDQNEECLSLYQDGTCFVKMDSDYGADGPV
jgi:hypothetical protein